MSADREILDMCGDKAGVLDIAMFEEFPRRFKTTEGIYVVLNNIFYVATSSFPENGRTKHLYHHEIVEAALIREGRNIPNEEIDNAMSNNAELMKLLGVSDAGGVLLRGIQASKRFEMGGGSGTFYAVADEADRIRSAGIAKTILGPEVQVVLI